MNYLVFRALSDGADYKVILRLFSPLEGCRGTPSGREK